MKKAMMMVNACVLVAFLAACGAQNDSTNEPAESNPPETNQTEDTSQSDNQDNVTEENTTDDEKTSGETDKTEATSQDDMKEMMAVLNFSEIEIDISYGSDQDYEAEIDHRDNGDIEADVEDDVNGIHIEDDLEAFNELYPKVKQLDITQDTAKEDVIQQVLQAFDLKDDYEKFDVEIKFNDGKKISYEDK